MAKVSQTAVQCFTTASLLPGCVIVADGIVQLWNLRNGKCVGEFSNILRPSKGKIGQQQGFVDAGERPHLTDFSSDITGQVLLHPSLAAVEQMRGQVTDKKQIKDEDTNNCGSIDAVMEATSLALSPTA